MATNLALDDALIESARRIGKHKTKKEAVTAALVEYIQHRRRLGILKMVGKVEYGRDYDHKALRRGKSVKVDVPSRSIKLINSTENVRPHP